MPDQNRPPEGGSRFEKLTKSVLETDHPLFVKVKKELPSFHRHHLSKHAWGENLLHWAKRLELPKIGLIVVGSMVLSFFIYRQITDPFLNYRLGDTVQRHLFAQKTIEFVDTEATEARRRSTLENVLSVYDYDRRIAHQVRARVSRAFLAMRREHQGVVNLSERKGMRAGELEKTDAFIDAKKAFSEMIEAEVTEAQFEALVRLKFAPRLERIFHHFLAEANLDLIVSNRELLKGEIGKGVTVNRLGGRLKPQGDDVFKNVSAAIDVEAAREELEKKASEFFRSPHNRAFSAYEDRITAIAKKLVIPNFTLNRQETEKRRLTEVNEIKPVIEKINKGEGIVKMGETINKRHLAILSAMQTQSDNFRIQFFFTAIFLSIILYSVVTFLRGGLQSINLIWKDYAAIALLMVSTILVVKGMQFLAAEAMIERFRQLPYDFYYYLLPMAAGPVIIRMLMDKEATLVYSVMLAFVGGILLERNFFYAAYILSSSLLAAHLARSVKTRGVVYRAGLVTALVNMLLITCIIANSRNAASLQMLGHDIIWILCAGVISGVSMSMIVMAVMPVVELVSGRTSDLRLLELANMNHPLLRDLMVKAPGTYHHSIVIGSLTEAAAEAIGANPLLARVMAYYHDVGKMERPLYFIENQGGGYNRHDGLQPHMSAMIIREHVKKGQELGRKFKLPQPLIDAMSEHHGSSTIWYFYNKARSQADDPETVLESDYKYDGFKPQTKETALVMLGDVVEAATRSVADPSPLRLSGVVKNILNKYFAEGQLAECDLTLRDLDIIAKSFLDVLLGIYHARIEYGVSSIRDSGKKRHGSSDPKGSPRVSAGGAVGAAPGTGPFAKPVGLPGAGGGGSKKS